MSNKTNVIYYQPVLSKEEWEKGIIPSFGVYRELKNAKEDFPKHQISAYSGDDIEDPQFIDDLDGRTPTYYVDVPPSDLTADEGSWVNVETFKTRPEAIAFAQEKYNADENGMVSLISVS